MIVPAGQLAYGPGHVDCWLEHVRGVTFESQTEAGFCIVQSSHFAPETPQAVSMKPASHKPDPSQHPVQFAGPQVLDATHVPIALQVELAGQTEQTLPPAPHCPCVVPPWQTPVASQQPAQFCGPQLLLNWQIPPKPKPASTGPGPGGGKPKPVQLELPTHTMHCSPLLPHALVLSPGWQVPVSSQQPPQFCGPQPPPSPAEQKPLLQFRPGGQGVHCCPPSPQAWALPPVTHVLPSQHPLQFWGPHVPLSMMGWQKPFGQTSLGGQTLHCPPPKPQPLVVKPPMHTLFRQQPPQFWGPQAPASNVGWQNPPWQAVAGGQTPQAWPPTPHAVDEPPPRQTGTGELPEIPQHPLQFDGPHGGTSHFPPAHVSFGGQTLQAPPPRPHPPTLVPVRHSLPEQQPGQLDGPQAITCFSQTLPVHTKPAGQDWQVSPDRPHWLFVVPPWQTLLGSQQPSQFCGPHWFCWLQKPPWQVELAGQKLQNWPPNPQAKGASPGWQLPLKSQQPGQFCGPQPPPSPGPIRQPPPSQTAFGGQAKHWDPKAPHWNWLPPPWQTPFWSQQPWQFCGPQDPVRTQAPPLQNVCGGQTAHWIPPNPQSKESPPPWQTPFWSQHPPQFAGEQLWVVQVPPTHDPPPQFWHCCPFRPHAFWLPPVMHWAPRQQPLQFCGPQGVAMHWWEPGSHTALADEQFWHCWPPVPQVLLSVPSTQRNPPAPLN